ncbi:MAG: NAD(P)H-dependent oxidoreductase [Pseudomonadota bacterium]|nr:NAD(P)H-dependent oxidoreductase [Pseudomonadota bacterium]
MSARHLLFLIASTREPGHEGNTEWLARQAAAALPAHDTQQWLRLADLALPPFVDLRHTTGSYPPPKDSAKTLLEATLVCTDLVLVAPVYWFSIPSSLKTYLDHWSGWMRTPGVAFKEDMARKRLYLVATSGNRDKAQPMIDSVRLCAEFLGMNWRGALWGKGGPPGAVAQDADAIAAARGFLAV